MSVSSVEGAANVVAPPPPPQMQPPEAKRADARDDTRLASPPVKAALPPGQGTRIDQLA
jgi:hypothetical protein